MTLPQPHPATPANGPEVAAPGQPPDALQGPAPAAPLEVAPAPFKSRGGVGRVWRAFGYSMAGLRAAVRHEAAFRQELALGLPLLVLAWVLAPTRWHALALSASIFLVWIAELLNSGIEALADAVSINPHPMLGRAKDLGSAAVMLALWLCLLTWAVVFWPV